MSEYNTGNDKKRLQESRQYWDDLASSFDDEPDHGLRDSLVLEAWTELLKTWIPAANATILDIGCGTGSLSVILARLGHTVTGIDLSPSMISLARTKAAAYGLEIEFHIMDASHAQFAEHQFDVILCRHLLWALSEPEQVLQRWIKLLKPGGRLILIEGYWRTGAGLHAEEITEMLPSSFINISVRNLSNDPGFWGGTVTDERYIIIADLDQKASHATENMNNES
ncbi:MAG TPA: methyltransferase domain-containing protein [Anaerolineales bacterium]|nr:methyltransferase domain-containing protein [Anaerolineales bacterium]